ncbi:MAG: periplasmic heavy metal sensor [Bryobacteraceae bacterium]|nr:periplasmic heavy metal sensor [Bryobacteraceae bacterium]
MTKSVLITLLAATLAFAQGPRGPRMMAPMGGPPPGMPGMPGMGPGAPMGASFDSLKAYLTLTDAQVTALQNLQTQNRDANRSTHEQIAAQQKALNDALKAGSQDAAALGKLLLQIHALRKQIGDRMDGLQAQARSQLTSAQVVKLKALEEAMALRDEIDQAMRLSLLTPPEPPAR